MKAEFNICSITRLTPFTLQHKKLNPPLHSPILLVLYASMFQKEVRWGWRKSQTGGNNYAFSESQPGLSMSEAGLGCEC